MTSDVQDIAHHSEYRADIDGLRAIAVLAVVAFHAAPGRLPGGFIGVDVFFVISGFLISSIIIRGLRAGTFTIADFYVRRVQRIFPALLIVMVACLVAGYLLLLDDELRELCKHVAGGAGFISNLVLWSEGGYFDHASDMKPLLHLWSLGVEEQFYFVWPLFLTLAARKQMGYGLPTLAVAGASFALCLWYTGPAPLTAFYFPVTRFWEILSGAGLAVYAQRQTHAEPDPRSLALRHTASLGGILLLLASLILIDKDVAFPGWWAVLPVAGTVAIVWSGPLAVINRHVLANRVLVWVGLISFPLYLWHWPALSFLRILDGQEVPQWKRLTAVAASFLLAWLTYELVEKRIRHRRNRFVTGSLLAAMGLVAGVGLFAYALDGFSQRANMPTVVNVGDIGHHAFFEHVWEGAHACQPEAIRREAHDWNGFTRCFQSQADGVAEVVLLGNSHAEHLYPGVAEALSGTNVAFFGGTGLPTLENGTYDHIIEVVVREPRIRTVILAANWGLNTEGAPNGDWGGALARLVDALLEAAKRVVIVDGVPSFSFLPSRCKFDGRLGVTNQCEEPDHEAARPRIEVLQDIAATHPQVRLVEIYSRFCSDGRCAMAHDGVLHFRDNNHLNVGGSVSVSDAILQELESP
jgi:peptidoglycan/LPS O-acetylase OafA/YrhL